MGQDIVNPLSHKRGYTRSHVSFESQARVYSTYTTRACLLEHLALLIDVHEH